MEKIGLSLGEDAQYLEPQRLQNSTDYKRYCDTTIKLYELILAEDRYIAGNGLRYIFSNN